MFRRFNNIDRLHKVNYGSYPFSAEENKRLREAFRIIANFFYKGASLRKMHSKFHRDGRTGKIIITSKSSGQKFEIYLPDPALIKWDVLRVTNLQTKQLFYAPPYRIIGKIQREMVKE